ncbi:hypothetical protein K9O30_06175 [Clostridium bowmanii]|uniref:hypothetical protein n=1 Tax=Clostridium bowmanii TaxID=132925 RepID=UPI001C0ABA3B|nr:hypothetical protein [Clostridium bowmanii]MBU3188746.1 hypothetical protein [Clostridium bowmanii]MCA1073331.1 hypothetical protein [Clostridium bowmanii]
MTELIKVTKIMKTTPIPISSKIFTKKDLKRISKIFIDEHKKCCDNDNQRAVLNFSWTLEDGSLLQTESTEILEENNETLDNEKTTRLRFSFYDLKENRDITLSLIQARFNASEILISSDNKEWSCSIIHSFHEALKYVKTQNNFFYKYKSSISNILLVINSIISFLITAYLGILKPNVPFYLSIITLFTVTYLGYLFIVKPINNLLLYKLWSSIEFDFGPEDKKVEKCKRKKTLWWLKWIGGTLIGGSIIGAIGSLIAWKLTK